MTLSPRLREMLANCYDFIFALVCLVMGILYLANTKLAVSVIVWVIFGACLVAGVINILRYLRRKPSLYDHDMSLAKGVGYTLAAIAIAVWPDRLLGLSAILTGLLLFADALAYLQSAVDSYRVGLGVWWLNLVAAAPCIALGLCFCLNVENPVVLGIGLIVTAVVSFALQIFLWMLVKQASGRGLPPRPAQPVYAAQPVPPVQAAQPAPAPAEEAPVPPAEEPHL